MTTTEARCAAAHPDDPNICRGDHQAVRVVDQYGEVTLGCVRHGAVLLASLEYGKVYVGPGGTPGAAVEAYQRAQALHPFAFDDYL